MEKKLNLFGILGLVILVAVSTMGSVKYQRAPRVLSGQAQPALACLPEASGSEFRSPHVWNGILIPPADVTNSLEADPYAVCPLGEFAGGSQAYQGIPVTGALPVFPQYQYRSANAAAGASSVFPQYQYRSSSTAASVSSVFPQYQYRSASATASRGFPQYQYRSAFAAPSQVFRQYQYRSFDGLPGLAPHKVLFSGH